jgi:hypothetical protein
MVPVGDQFDIDYTDEYYDPTSSPGRASQRINQILIMSFIEQIRCLYKGFTVNWDDVGL